MQKVSFVAIAGEDAYKITQEYPITAVSKTNQALDKEVLLKVKDSGNGLICKFPAASCIEQDYYVCLDYSHAHYLFMALKSIYKDTDFTPPDTPTEDDFDRF